MAGRMAARRRRGPAGKRPPLLLALLLLVAAVLPTRGAAQRCDHSTGDALLERLEARFDRCMGAGAFPEAREALTGAFVANEFDRQAPLALALFSNSSGALDALAAAVATALFGDRPPAHATQVADLARLVTADGALERRSNYEVKEALRSALAVPLRACPSRSLVVVRNVQALDDAALPVLDVFLDPLNGRRAQFQSLDCANAVFLFLFQVDTASSDTNDARDSSATAAANASRLWTERDGSAWREFLMRRWTRPAETHAAEEFTPQALVGRLTAGLALMSFWAPAAGADAAACQLPSVADEAELGGRKAEEPAEEWATQEAAFTFLLGFLALLLAAKSWNQETTRRRESSARGHGARHKSKGRKTRRKR